MSVLVRKKFTLGLGLAAEMRQHLTPILVQCRPERKTSLARGGCGRGREGFNVIELATKGLQLL